MSRFIPLFVLFSIALLHIPPVSAQDVPSIAENTEGMTHLEGFFDLYWDEDGGKVWLEIDSFGDDFLYAVSLAAGLGSNDIGLDRNQLGPQRIVRFERRGPKVFLIEPNLNYIADTDNAAERKSVADAFASSVIHGFTVAARTDERILVDATDFVVRDAHGVVGSLRSQGGFRLDASRSAPYREQTKSFPENTEMEAMLTFASDSPSGTVRSVAADGSSVTLRQRHSFIQLPPPGFEPRRADPRAGYFGVSYADYSVPIGKDMVQRFISRHRLEKKNPSAAMSEPVEPIVYYLDAGTPEPVRSALLEGGRWWNQAFEAAGYIDAFRVEVMPEDGDPLDVRYNVINWVHRSTRGWSYGSSITDPRTGEILKGHVLLGSLRVRQDYLIAEGLLAPYEPTGALPPGEDPMLEMALARIRQLSAHEIGHTLGIQHNFVASVNNRASVMDYPAPLATLDADGSINLDAAYDTGIGEWDIATVRYGYSDFPDGTDEAAALEALLAERVADGLQFISDSDARPAGGAHPTAHLWDNGSEAVEALELEMDVREAALARFGAGVIPNETPMATLEEALVPLYLRHRYQIDAVSKLVGGVRYTYTIKGDAQDLPAPVPANRQEAALQGLLGAISPEALALPPQIRTVIPPRPPWFGQNRELFDGHTGLVFDPYAPGAVVAQQVVDLLLHPDRAARLVYQKDFESGLPDLSDVLTAATEAIWLEDVPRDAYEAELQRVVQQVWVDALLDAAVNAGQAPAVRSRVTYHLKELHQWLSDHAEDGDYETLTHRTTVFDEVDRYLFRPYQPEEVTRPLSTPPGSPIGSGETARQPRYGFEHRVDARRAWLRAWEEATAICLVGEGF